MITFTEESIICCSCPAKDVPKELRRLRERSSNTTVTAVPNPTASEEFFKYTGIQIH